MPSRMKNSTRSILTGALAGGLLLTSPLAAGAAVPSSVPSVKQYEGHSVPSSVADLTTSATIQDGATLSTEPGSGLDFTLPPSVHAVGSPGAVRASPPFTASGESWIAVEVPTGAHGADLAKSALADPGVAYVRALYVKAAPATAPADSATYPTKVSELTMGAYTRGPEDLYLKPELSAAQKMTGVHAQTPAREAKFLSSAFFSAGGHRWVAILVPKELAPKDLPPSGIAYITAETDVNVVTAEEAGLDLPVVNPAQPTAMPTAAGPSALPALPSASAAPTAAAATEKAKASPAPSAIAAERVSDPEAGSQPNWLAAIGSLVVGGLATFSLWWTLKRRGA